MFAEDISEDFSDPTFTGFYSISGYLRNLRGRLLSSERFSEVFILSVFTLEPFPEIALRDCNFQARLKRMTFSSKIENSSEPPTKPLFFVGISQGQDWTFQARLKFSSEIENFKRKLEIFKRSSEIDLFSRFGPPGFVSATDPPLFFGVDTLSRSSRGSVSSQFWLVFGRFLASLSQPNLTNNWPIIGKLRNWEIARKVKVPESG